MGPQGWSAGVSVGQGWYLGGWGRAKAQIPEGLDSSLIKASGLYLENSGEPLNGLKQTFSELTAPAPLFHGNWLDLGHTTCFLLPLAAVVGMCASSPSGPQEKLGGLHDA